MTTEYLAMISLIERLHRHFLEMIKVELDRSGIVDINNIQALMLFNIGDAQMTVGKLMLRGCYIGPNVSYNLKKLTENGYTEQTRSPYDRRSVYVRLTEKGRKLRDFLATVSQRHAESLSQSGITAPGLESAVGTMRLLEDFWIHTCDKARRPSA